MIDLNDIAVPKTRHDLAAVKERLACTARRLAAGALPRGPARAGPPILALRGPLRALAAQGGLLHHPSRRALCRLGLRLRHRRAGRSHRPDRAGDRALRRRALRRGGAARGDGPSRAAARAGVAHARAPDHSAEIARLVGGAVPIAGTPGETYLRARGLSDPGSPDLLFHPDLADFDSCRGWPGLIAILRLPDGERAPGIHRTFLLDDGSAKAPPGKKMLGSVKDAVGPAVPDARGRAHRHRRGHRDGARRARALRHTGLGCAVRRRSGAVGNGPKASRRVTIYADAGDAGRQAAATLATASTGPIPNESSLRCMVTTSTTIFCAGRSRRGLCATCRRDSRKQAADPTTPRRPPPSSLRRRSLDLDRRGRGADQSAELKRSVHAARAHRAGKLDPLPERQVIARIKSATGIGMSVLTSSLPSFAAG